ncbi:GSCOCG00000156001-RA-CDS, partial [Cotesia congregata]
MELSRAWILLVCCLLAIGHVTSAPNPQEPAFELPVQLVGFPVIIAAVRITNFIKKLAYSLNPQTYMGRSKRSVQDEEILDIDQVEKKLIAELGEKVCIYERTCAKFAAITLKKGYRDPNLDWDEIFRYLYPFKLELYIHGLSATFVCLSSKYSIVYLLYFTSVLFYSTLSCLQYKSSPDPMKENYLLSVFMGEIIGSPRLCHQLSKRLSEKVCREEQLGMMYLCSSSMSQCPQTKVTWLVKNISLVLILVLLGLLRTHPVVSSPKRGPLPRNDGNYYQYPGQIYPTDPNPRPGILGINLLEAFSSINKYDDRKCVHRIICEVASGVTPGNVGFKRANSIFGIGSLIDYLTTRTFDISSPLLTFGKSALMGWNNRGNPDICYQRYPQCPRSQNELISYLNNYNGGFFRFFNYRNTGSYNRGLDAVDSQMVSDRKATGELKFDTPSSRTVLVERSKKNDDHNRVVFPDQQYVKIMDYTDSDKFNNSPESSFFPQDRKDQKVEELVYDFHSDKSSQSEDKDKEPSAVPKESQQASRGSHKNHGKLYLPTKNTPYSTKKLSSYTFPDGQRIMIDTTFSKLFSDSYKKPLKRGLVNNAPRAIDMEGLYVINLTELYPTVNDDTRPVEEQIIHPCDVICHDSRGTAVQFTQFVNSNDDNSNINSNYASADKNKFLTTLMTPEHPILDLSKRLPCQIICLNARGQRRRITTTFNKIIRSK